MKKFDVAIGFRDPYHMLIYKHVKIEAKSIESAVRKARKEARYWAKKEGHQFYFIKSVVKIS